MSNKRLLAPQESELLLEVESLLADPAHQDHPLRDALARLFEYSEGQRERLERLVRISDGYHDISRAQSQTLSERYDRQLRRLEKLARISDRYQNSLREMSEALRDAAFRDPLTGLGNRRFLMDRLRENFTALRALAIERSENNSAILTVLADIRQNVTNAAAMLYELDVAYARNLTSLMRLVAEQFA